LGLFTLLREPEHFSPP